MSENKWQIFSSVEESWKSMYEAIKDARESIYFEQYIFTDYGQKEIGREFLDLFKQKAKEGIEINLLIDLTGSFSFSNEMVETLEEMGVKVLFNAPHRSMISGRFPHIHINHRKLIVIDKKIAFIGGIIFQENYRNWADVGIRFEGPVVEPLLEAFTTMKESMETGNILSSISSQEKGAEFRVEAQRPGMKNREIYRSILKRIRSAQHSITIVTPYLSPTQQFLRALYRAAQRGVDVKILIPEKTEYKLVTAVNRSYVQDFLKKNIKVHFYEPFSIHAKIVVVDDWVTVGSCNMDTLSTWFNYELNVSTESFRFLEDMKGVVHTYLSKSRKITRKEWALRNFRRRIYDFSASYFRRFT